uniref:Uncharacterized protein n=1 Tax=Lepeophtheirus salmonis TaxID=72036 RepID=A0A0K2TJT7_LEPSM
MLDSSETTIETIVDTVCDQGYKWASILGKISQILFNVMYKTLVSQLNDNIRQESRKKILGKQVKI